MGAFAQQLAAKFRDDRGLILGLVLGVVTAFCVYGPSYIFGTSEFWQYPPTDLSSHVIGYRMYVLDAWRFPLFHTATIEDPRGLNLLYMDALPIVALPAKLIGPIVPGFLRTAWANPIAWWPAVSYGLQGYFGARLMRELTDRSVAAELSGAAVAVAMPVFVFRFQHTALASHFFILASLLLYVQSARGLSTRRAVLRWTAFFCAVTLVHPYLFVMCAGVFAATLAKWAMERRWRDALVVGAVSVTAVLGIVVLGGFHGERVTQGGHGAYGQRSPDLVDGWIHPITYGTDLISFFTPQWATFFPFTHPFRIDMARSETAEGWAYVGAGVLLATVVALAMAPRMIGRAIRNHRVLVIALSVMALFAISNRIAVGLKVLVDLPLPSFLDWPTRQFRSCGRFIWPAIYAGAFTVVAVVFRRTRSTRWPFVAPALATIQFVDVLAGFLYVGEYTSRGENRFLDWNVVKPVILEQRRITFAPSFECVHWTHPIVAYAQMEVEYMAAERGIALSSVRSSRPVRDCRREAVEFAHAPVTNDLYLMFLSEVPRGTSLHFELAGAPCASFRVGVACSKKFASALPRGFEPFVPDLDYALGQTLSAGDKAVDRHFGTGWSWPEGTHRWTDGQFSFVYLRLDRPVPAGARVVLRAAGALGPKRPSVSSVVRVNGVVAGEIPLQADAVSFDLPLPAAVIGKRLLEIELQPSDVRTPAELGGSTDTRALGLAVVSLAVVP